MLKNMSPDELHNLNMQGELEAKSPGLASDHHTNGGPGSSVTAGTMSNLHAIGGYDQDDDFKNRTYQVNTLQQFLSEGNNA